MARKPGRPQRADVNWRAVEQSYRHSRESVRAIAKAHGVSDGIVRLRARNEGWKRPAGLEQRAGRPPTHRGTPCPLCKRPMPAALAEKVAVWLAADHSDGEPRTGTPAPRARGDALQMK